MHYAESILDLVGDTPLVRISRLTRDLGPQERQPLLLAKLEMLNPGGSVKDRIGLPMIEAAEQAGLLKPGGTIIEPTSGNTGHGLAIAAALKGYRCIFVMADKQSAEKQQLLRAYGAEVVLCPTNVAPDSPESYYSVAARLARDIPGAFKPDQYWNKENPIAHERTTGPELWERTEGRITHFVASVGTGGTISGAAHVLKAHNPAIEVIGADPEGSVLSGDVARPYLTEGVGEDFFPGTYDPSVVDRWVRVSDRDAFAMARRLTREEGILAGGSCGTAMVAALEVARGLTAAPDGADAVIVVLLPDSGRSYLSKIYNDEWMRANGLLATTGAVVRVEDLLRDRHHVGPLPAARPGPDHPARRRGHRDPPGVRDQPAPGLRAARRRRPRRVRRVDHREGPARPRLPRPIDRRADRRGGHGHAAPVRRRRGEPRPGLRPAQCRGVGGRRDPGRSADRGGHPARRPRVPRPPARRTWLIRSLPTRRRWSRRSRTERFELVSMSLRVHGAARWLATSRRAELEIGAIVPVDLPDTLDNFLQFRIADLSIDPEAQPWLGRAIVQTEADGTRRIIGSCGFHAPPGPDGRVEVGYRVEPPYRRQGIATEVVHALFDWAHGERRRSLPGLGLAGQCPVAGDHHRPRLHAGRRPDRRHRRRGARVRARWLAADLRPPSHARSRP